MRDSRRARGVRCASYLAVAVLAVAPQMATSQEGDWTIPPKDFANTRYSTLNDITEQNVSQLKLSFTFSTGVLRGHEAAPIVAG